MDQAVSRQRLKRNERFARIIDELRLSPTVRISELAETFGVSAETVRRDIDELSRQGLVDRTYGGAAAHALAHEPAVNERYRLHVEERTRLIDEWFPKGQPTRIDGLPPPFIGAKKASVLAGGRLRATLSAPLNWDFARLREAGVLPGVGNFLLIILAFKATVT